MHVKSDYRDEALFERAIDEIRPNKQIQTYLKRRYLEYLKWLERGSATNLIVYYGLRIPAIVLAALVPALIALDLGTVGRTVTVFLGVIVAATTAVEHFLASGQRWRHYRGSVELMKSEGWLFLHRTGPYSGFDSLETAFPEFVGRVESLMRDEVREYVSTIIAQEQPSATGDAGQMKSVPPSPGEDADQ
jgi:hypothetical protein